MAKLNGVKTVDMVNGEITKVAYDGAEYAKVETSDTLESAQVGDIIENKRKHSDITIGAFYEVVEAPPHIERCIRIFDDTGENHSRAINTANLFRKISADKPTLEQRVESLESDVATLKGEKKSEEKSVTIEFEGATYRKVYREAREGDVVIARKANGIVFRNNVPYKVVAVGESGPETKNYVVYRKLYNRTRETVDVYEPIEQAKYVPQEGDIVVITATGTHDFSIGDIVKIDEVVSHGSNPYRGKFADKRTPFVNYLYE